MNGTEDNDGIPTLAEMAEDVRLAEALASGELELRHDPTADVPELPPPGSPVSVVRPIRLPFEVDEAVKAIADANGLSVSALIREWVVAKLVSVGHRPDPVTELRRSLDTAQHALSRLTAREAA